MIIKRYVHSVKSLEEHNQPPIYNRARMYSCAALYNRYRAWNSEPNVGLLVTYTGAGTTQSTF
jgi:hypothetical protein